MIRHSQSGNRWATMKKFLLASVAFAAIAGPAMAADMRLPPPPQPVAYYDWTGAYIGFHAGAQWQWGAWVLGAEAALSGCFSECRATSGVVPPPGIAPNTFFQHKITNLFTVGPRLG